MELDTYLSEKQKRRKKRRRYVRLVFALVVVGAVLVGGAWLVFRSPLFRITNIAVAGNNAVSSDSVTTLLQSSVLRDHSFWKSLLGINNILIWPRTLTTSDLAFIPQLASLTITKDYLARTVVANVAERTPFGIWCFVVSGAGGDSAGGGGTGNAAATSPAATTAGAATSSGATMANEDCYWFDSQGVLFGKTFDTQGSLMFSVHDYSQDDRGLGGTILSPEFVPNLISIVNVLRASGVQVNEIALNNISLEEIDVATYNGPALYFSLRFPADEDLAVLQNLMAKPSFSKLQYVDFTVANRAYYK